MERDGGATQAAQLPTVVDGGGDGVGTRLAYALMPSLPITGGNPASPL